MRKHKTTKYELVKQHLLHEGHISRFEARRLYGCNSMAEYMSRFRQNGLDIITLRVYNADGSKDLLYLLKSYLRNEGVKFE